MPVKIHHFIIGQVSEHHKLGAFETFDVLYQHFGLVLAMAALGTEDNKNSVPFFFQILSCESGAVRGFIKREFRNGRVAQVGSVLLRGVRLAIGGGRDKNGCPKNK